MHLKTKDAQAYGPEPKACYVEREKHHCDFNQHTKPCVEGDNQGMEVCWHQKYGDLGFARGSAVQRCDLTEDTFSSDLQFSHL